MSTPLIIIIITISHKIIYLNISVSRRLGFAFNFSSFPLLFLFHFLLPTGTCKHSWSFSALDGEKYHNYNDDYSPWGVRCGRDGSDHVLGVAVDMVSMEG